LVLHGAVVHAVLRWRYPFAVLRGRVPRWHSVERKLPLGGKPYKEAITMAWRLIETRELLGNDGIPGQIKIYDVGNGVLEAEITLPLHREEQADLLVKLLAELWRNLNSGAAPQG
jgi:hypothetical protein